MKRLLALLLAVATLCTLCACGKKAETPADQTAASSPPPGDMATLAEQFITAYVMEDWLTYYSLFYYDKYGQWKARELSSTGLSEADYCAAAEQQAAERGVTFDYPLDSMDAYLKAKHEVELKDKLDAYGTYTLTATATDHVRMTDAETTERRGYLLSQAEGYGDEASIEAITEIYTVTVQFTIDGEKKDLTENYVVYIANYNGEWRVVGHST